MTTLYYERPDYNSLQHHGIQGQKWGVKNGPPYPLDEKDHSVAEKKAENDTSKSKKSGLQLTDKQKKAILIGAGVTVVALAVVGGIYISKNPQIIKSLSVRGKNALKGKAISSNINVFGNEGQDAIDNIIIANAKATKRKNRGLNGTNDCTNIWSQMAAQLNGRFDVEANCSKNSLGNSAETILSYFKSKQGVSALASRDLKLAVFNNELSNSKEKITKQISRISRGENNTWGYVSASIRTINGYERHAMMWTNIDNNITICDGISGSAASNYFNDISNINYYIKNKLPIPTQEGFFDTIIFRADNLVMDVDAMIKDGILRKI